MIDEFRLPSEMHTLVGMLHGQGLKELKQTTIQMAAGSRHETEFDIEKEIDDLLPVEVKEQRLTNLLQAIMVGGCVAAMPFVKMIPTS
ncbi:hypothetical protein OIU78_028500 [Salix suchowensis]|nr:hypothetical protein OIU78_028500 [Salix suchowensis]